MLCKSWPESRKRRLFHSRYALVEVRCAIDPGGAAGRLRDLSQIPANMVGVTVQDAQNLIRVRDPVEPQFHEARIAKSAARCVEQGSGGAAGGRDGDARDGSLGMGQI